ncbi:MAG: ABC transporter permease [Actinomycetota bacterium]|nr:ABC transporter permease [Actinomycetota bacterium]
MSAHLLRRVLLAVPTLLGLSLLVFTLVSMAPGDPAVEYARRTSIGGEVTPVDVERARAQLGLDRPFAVQYGAWLTGAARGDLSESFARGTSVTAEIGQRLPATAELTAAAFLLTILTAVPLGIAAAVLHHRWPDNLLRVLALVGASIPGFFLAYVLIGVFATRLTLLPVAGQRGLSSLVLPAVALAVGPTALVSRLLRSSLLETFGQDYVRTAQSKGLGVLRIVVKHALRNGAIPVVTVLGGVLAGLLEGAVIIEVIFAWPGVGKLTYDAIVQRDYPLVQGLVLVAGAVYILLNLLVDASYALLDPRVSESL